MFSEILTLTIENWPDVSQSAAPLYDSIFLSGTEPRHSLYGKAPLVEPEPVRKWGLLRENWVIIGKASNICKD